MTQPRPEPTNSTQVTPVPSATPPSERRARSRGGWGHRLALGLLVILSCLVLVASTLGLWMHQVVLNTDRYTQLIANVSAQPAVIDGVSQRVADQVVTVLGVETILAQNLPPRISFMAGPLTVALTERLQEGLAKVIASPTFQKVWVEANRVAHAKAVALLRGDTTVVTIEGGVVTLNLLPLVGAALQQLQDSGLIPASVTLPDLSSGLPADVKAQLEGALGVTIPPDFGQVPLFTADRLVALQTGVRIFDALVIVLLLVTAALMALTVYIAHRRWRMVLTLAIGALVAFAITRLIIAGIESQIISSIADDSAATTVKGIVDDVLGDLYGVARIVLVGIVLVAIVAYLAELPPAVMGLVSAVRNTLRGAPAAGAGSVGEEGAVAEEGAAGLTLGGWAQAHRTGLLIAGVAVVGLLVIAAALGTEWAFLTLGLLALVALILQAAEPEPEAVAPPSAPSPAAAA